MATSLTLENDSSLAQGYLKVNGSTAATLTTSGITANLTGNADTATKFSTTTGSAPAYACRAWVNFDGTRDSSGAVSSANTNRFIRSSGNVASVLRNATGDYTITFTTPMSDANYSASFMGGLISSNNNGMWGSPYLTKTTSQFRLQTSFWSTTRVLLDVDEASIQIFGN
jgi:hypothetical protein